MAAITLKRLFTGIIPASVLFLLLLGSLHLLYRSTEALSKETFGDNNTGGNFELLLGINSLALLILTVLIGVNIYRLVKQYRRNIAGSRLNVRMVVMFIMLSVTPLLLVFYFSYKMLNLDIDKQSRSHLRIARDSALILSREPLNLLKREMLKRTRSIAEVFGQTKSELDAIKMHELRDQNEANELMLVEGNRIIAFNTSESSVKQGELPKDVLYHLKQNTEFAGINPKGESGLTILVAVPVLRQQSNIPSISGVIEDRFVVAIYPVAKHIETLASKVQDSVGASDTIQAQRDLLKSSYTLTLVLVLMLSLTAAIWAAFFSTRRMVRPIKDLADATRAVADGHYDRQIQIKSHDELAFLVESFNEMTRRIALANQAARQSQTLAEDQRAYLDAVLLNLTSGVITCDRNMILQITNAEAGKILGVNLSEFMGKSLSDIAASHQHLHGFFASLVQFLVSDQKEWRAELELFNKSGRQVLVCRGTSLSDDTRQHGDHVIVFDDMTGMLQAQRDSAWGEVARRLAHEIKNPLTPIQLSAERLRQKYLKTMTGEDAQQMDRLTHTIVQQVEAMKAMVNAFSEYARAPKIVLTETNINSIIQEVSDLYIGGGSNIQIKLLLEPTLPVIDADANRLRQLLNNLIKNALEAMEKKRKKQIDLNTRTIQVDGSSAIELVVRDYGDGFPEDTQGQHFEPYFTTKPKGTGLGLAIVKRIVEEHNGVVSAENTVPKGAKITIRIPVPRK